MGTVIQFVPRDRDETKLATAAVLDALLVVTEELESGRVLEMQSIGALAEALAIYARAERAKASTHPHT